MSEGPRRAVRWIEIVLLAAVYLAIAKLSMAFASQEGVAPIWPAGGVATAAVIARGQRLWPGIAAGAFLDPMTAGLPAVAALGGAVANTAAPCLGVWLLRRSIGDRDPFEHARDVFRFIAFPGALGAAVAATVGAASLCLAEVAPWPAYAALWQPWWLSDLVGVLVVTPVLLEGRRLRSVLADRRSAAWEGALLLAVAAGAGWLVFGAGLGEPATFIPLLLWAVFRFGSGGAAVAVLLVSGLGVWSTVGGADRFSSVLVLQSFIAAISGTILVLVAVLSERRRAEARLAEANRGLERRVAARTEELEKKNLELEASLRELAQRGEELELSETRSSDLLVELEAAQESLLRKQRLAALGELAGSVGHEIRNPLAVIRNSVYFLGLTRLLEGGKGEEHLRLIENEVRRADRIVAELLDYGRDAAPVRQRRALQEIVARAIDAVSVPVDVHLGQQLQSQPLEVEADPGQIERCVINLLRNAVQAMPQGGSLQVACFRRGDEAVVAVRDTGVGIAEDDVEKIFEPLFTGRARGIGLGLPVSQRYARANGGRIECESELGKGSTFRLLLPAAGR